MPKSYRRPYWEEGEDDGRNWGIVQTSWMPKVNRYGGWYGKDTRPGEVQIAFVAERVNENIVRPDWPPLYGGNSGMYLWRAIIVAGLKVHDMYYTNAVKPLGVIDDLEAELQGEVLADRVVALGKHASKALWTAGVAHYAIPHPAFWHRFMYNANDPHAKTDNPYARGGMRYYARLIKEIASD